MTLPKGSKHSAKQGLTGHFPGSFVPLFGLLFFGPQLYLCCLAADPTFLYSSSVWFSASHLTRFIRRRVQVYAHYEHYRVAAGRAHFGATPSIFSFHFPLCVV